MCYILQNAYIVNEKTKLRLEAFFISLKVKKSKKGGKEQKGKMQTDI